MPYMVRVITIQLFSLSLISVEHVTDFLQDTSDYVWVIQIRLRSAQRTCKSYTHHRCWTLRFVVGDQVFIRLSL